MVVYTAVIYVQRFYMQETIDDYDPLVSLTKQIISRLII